MTAKSDVVLPKSGCAPHPHVVGETRVDRVLGAAVFALAVVLSVTGCASSRQRVPPPTDVMPTLAGSTQRGVPVVAIDTAAANAAWVAARRPDALDVLTGSASYYADSLAGRLTASGVPYNPDELTAAHPDLPFGTVLRVTSVVNGLSVEVRVTDRGPFAYGRVLDLSRSAAEALDMIQRGHVEVIIEVLSYGG